MGRVLIVEDHKLTQEGLIKVVKDIDKSIEVFATGYAGEALKYAKENKVDTFFLDIQLMDYSGLELANQIREVEEYLFTPIVFLTAIPTRELEAFKQIHCYDYIVKPFCEKEVCEVINKVIKNYINKESGEQVLRIQRKGFINIIKQKEIIYIEFKERKVEIITKKERIYYSTHTLKQIITELSKDFVQVHKAFIVNKNFINNIDLKNNVIYLDNVNFSIPIGRTYKKTIGGSVL